MLRQRDPEGFGKLLAFEQEHALNLRDDLAAPLGGEFLVRHRRPGAAHAGVEGGGPGRGPGATADSARYPARRSQPAARRRGQAGLRHRAGHEKAERRSTASAVGGQPSEIHYTFGDGYWLLAPDRLVLKDALRTRASGLTLAASAQFRRALPVDGQKQYSALVYVNAGTLGSALAAAVPVGAAAAGQPRLAELKNLLAKQSVMAFCVTAERDRIVITSTGIDLLNPGQVIEALARAQLSTGRHHAPPEDGSAGLERLI